MQNSALEELLSPTEASTCALGGGAAVGGGGGGRPVRVVQVGVGALVAAGTLLSELDLQALDHTVLLLQLFGQPDEGDEEQEEEEDLGGVSQKKRRAGLDFCMLGVQLV